MPIKSLIGQSAATSIHRLLLAGLLLTFLAGCSSKQHPVTLQFAATWNADPIGCSDGPVSLSDLRFYVSDIALIDQSGKHHAVLIRSDDEWQQDGLVLIDLEDGQGTCTNGTKQMNSVAVGSSTASTVSAVQFTLGVPFDVNHANPLTASAPLDRSAMHWHWRSGYKFLRAGVASVQDGYWIHLGSTGCEGEVGNITECTAANRVGVHLDGFDPTTDRIVLDLAALFAKVDLSDGAPSDCSSRPAEESCNAPFEALGLYVDDASSANQSAFRIAK